MDKKYSLILALLFTGLIASNYFLFTALKPVKIESAIVSRAIDSDTIEIEGGRVLRLVNINAPEKNTLQGKKSLGFLSFIENKNIEFESLGREKYGRTLARVYIPEYLNLLLVRQGYASKFLVKEGEERLFNEAEEDAIRNEKGIWRKSQFQGCFSSDIDWKREIVLISSLCGKINISGWILKDESRKQYKFNSVISNAIRLHSGSGNDNSTDIFWGQEEIWNNDKDTLYLFDNLGNLAYHFSYGY